MLWIDGTKSAVADLDSRIGRPIQVLQVSTDRYRDRARHCVIKAGQAQRTEAKLSWLYMAQTWLSMIPEPQRTAKLL
jgi:hypothetical protein